MARDMQKEERREPKRVPVSLPNDAGSQPFEIRANPHSGLKKEEADVLLQAFEKLLQEDGQLDAERLIEISKPRTSPTHGLFEWDDAKAAHEHRLHAARCYIGSFEITFEGFDEPLRAFPKVKIDGQTTRVPMARALTQEELYNQLLEQARTELRRWTRRYEALRSPALTQLFDTISKFTQ